jgi:hypothetical protein
MRSIEDMKLELGAVIDRGLQLGGKHDRTAAEDMEFASIEATSTRLATEIRAVEREAAIRSMGPTGPQRFEMGAVPGTSLADTTLDAGWNRKTRTSVTVDSAVALKTGSVNGGVDGTEIAFGFTAPLLGGDSRYLYPHMSTQAVAGDATGVQSYRQASRTLGTPSNMIQAIDYASAKEETDTDAEVVSEPLKMIANVSSGTPNILLASDSFRSWVNFDLVSAYRNAVDFHIVDQITNASIPGGGGGNNAYEDILYSQETVRSAGYDPSLVVMSPSDALTVQLLTMSSGVTYAFGQSPPSVVVSPSVEDGGGFVCDPGALGVLFLGPAQFAAFEEDAGSTNTSTVRFESSGLFLVQRADAAASLSAS